MSRPDPGSAAVLDRSEVERLFVHPSRDLGAPELWERSRARSEARRALLAAGGRRRRSLVSEALLDLDGPVPPAAAWERDLTQENVWDLSARVARAKRKAVRKPVLVQTRAASASLLVAAVAATVPATGGAQSKNRRAAAAQVDVKLLRMGSRGSAVASVQRALGITADGVFGPKTRAAVKAFQKRQGLVVDGIVGPKTRAALPAGGGAATTAKTFRAPWVAGVQRQLGVAADGIFGPKTRAAVVAFQKRHGLVPDGIVGPRTRAALAGASPRDGRRGGKPMKTFRAPWVAPVQRALGVPADGVFGPQTRAAVLAFQKRKGLVVDGIVGPQTLAALGLAKRVRLTPPSPPKATPSQPSSVAAKVVQAARAQTDKPYAWGGNGPGSFDCSGLTVWAFRAAGISLPRTSQAQYGSGRAVARSAVRAGDLVFFATNGPGASHVGIAISNASFISATSSGGVRVQPISGSYWGSTYVGARRVG